MSKRKIEVMATPNGTLVSLPVEEGRDENVPAYLVHRLDVDEVDRLRTALNRLPQQTQSWATASDPVERDRLRCPRVHPDDPTRRCDFNRHEGRGHAGGPEFWLDAIDQ